MQPRIFFSTLSALQLLAAVGACPFHGHAQHTSLNNHRRSLPAESAKTSTDNIRVFDGCRFSLAKTICFDAGYIVDTNGCDEAEVKINGSGKFLIPGLIDSHLHLQDVASLEKFTSYGCTTAMHMNCEDYTQCDINAKQPGLASFIYAGRSAGGNGSAHEKTEPTRPKDTLIYPDTNVTQWTEWQFNNVSNFLKLTAEVNGPSTQQQIEMIRVAHYQYHKQAMTHAADLNAYSQAVESVTDGIQHVPDDGLLDNATIQQIKAQNQFVTPTLNVFKYAFSDPILASDYFGVQPGSNHTMSHVEANAKALYRAGVPLIAGTDSVGPLNLNGTIVTVPWGLSLHHELENLVQIVGMSPAEAINAATREAAKWHRVLDRGSIETGKRADLLMLNSDPLANISNTQDFEEIWVFGIEVAEVAKIV
ncbi:uncharacterized protein LY89DRAFT_752265 [Mollisia scopiformis]|uniref:Amidohydrolase-related domain-containing protein n=1 Tax=Mollisia scopiformis TaxID=149040 RepID=A0A194X290_MOLSC|nr:uncharacterized protein LY89DRAFT_752265 [Mollisia scopiformis]KUJ14320.1 hypothetical protein LY89DRAFT_752265 [Mollisia scopiformis]